MRIRRVSTIVLVVAAALALAGCDWAQIGFGPDGSAANPSEPALTASSVAHLHTAWSTACTCSTPLVVGDTAYVLDDPRQPGSISLRAFDATSGSQRWSTVVGTHSLAADVTVNLDAVANGLTYLRVQPRDAFGQPSASARLQTFDAATGAPRWTVTPPAAGSGIAVLEFNVVVDGPLAFVGATGGSSTELSAVDQAGRVIWSDTPGGLGGAVAANPGRTVSMLTFVVTSTGGSSGVPVLTTYDESTGVPTATVIPKIGPVGVPHLAFANGLVYGFQDSVAGSGGVGLFAVRPETGALVWSTGENGLGAVASRLVGPLFAAPSLVARDPLSGSATWTIGASPGAVGTVVAGGLVYFGAGDALRVVRLSDGGAAGSATPVATESVSAVTPSNGRVFVATTGHLVALTP